MESGAFPTGTQVWSQSEATGLPPAGFKRRVTAWTDAVVVGEHRVSESPPSPDSCPDTVPGYQACSLGQGPGRREPVSQCGMWPSVGGARESPRASPPRASPPRAPKGRGRKPLWEGQPVLQSCTPRLAPAPQPRVAEQSPRPRLFQSLTMSVRSGEGPGRSDLDGVRLRWSLQGPGAAVCHK